MTLYYLSIFYFGAILGSFFYTLALRYLTDDFKENPLKTLMVRSQCPHCSKRLNILQLMPFFGLLIYRGKCPSCNNRVSYLYPLFEVVFGLLLVLYIVKFGLSVETGLLYLFSAVMLTISIIDVKSKIIPDSLILTLLVLSMYPVFVKGDILQHIYGMIALSLFFMVVLFIFPGSFGGGDVKLAAVLGLLSGLEYAIVLLEAALIIGSFTGVIYVLVKRSGLKVTIPFAPFLYLGFLIAQFMGSEILLLYYKTFG